MKTNIWKRLLSAFLALVMVLAMVPAVGMVQEAEAAPTNADSYITMPITIRDFAADGMLFEFNQVGASGTTGAAETSTHTIAGTNPSYSTWINNLSAGVYIVTYAGMTQTGPWGAGLYAHMAICDASGNIKKVLGYGESKGTYSSTKAEMQSGWYVVWCFNSAPAYSTLSAITSSNMSNYKLTYSGSTLTVKVAASGAAYNQGDTAGFSMLSTGANDYINNLERGATTNSSNPSSTTSDSDLPNTLLIENGYWGLTDDPEAITATLNSGAKQKVYGAWIRTDLVQPTLVNGKPVYTKDAVNYLADYMKQIFAVPYQTDDAYNTYYPTGVKLFDSNKQYVGPNSSAAIFDLADLIRGLYLSEMGDYATAQKKFNAGNLTTYDQATTWCEAAYFLLHNTWNDSAADADKVGSDGYGMPISNYKNIHLIQTTNEDGDVCYVFNSGYDGAVYDYTKGEIYNTQTTTITAAPTSSGGEQYVRGNKLPKARFDPLGPSGAGANLGYGMSGDTYGDMVSESKADWNEYYDETNYHLSLEGHAQFIYYEDSNLYFTFTGDDDVYLYINGIRVLDVGAAHSISKVEINLNDVAEMCGLKDGQAYDFDFFYMERHGTAANFGIETNIKIVDPAMTTTKEGFQNMISTGYNGYVDPLVPVYYTFGLQNNGKAPIEDLTFRDDDIGVYLSKDTITLNEETKNYRQYLGAIVYNADGSTKSQTDGITDDELKTLLDGELAVGEKIIVYGFRYTIPEAVWEAGDGTFPNTVYTTAVGVGDNAGKNLNGMADWKVQKRQYSFQDYHVYEWMGHGVTLTKDELLQQLVDNVEGFDPEAATIAVSTASGTTTGVNVNKKAVLNNGSITYTGTETGADVFYYKVTEGAVEAVIGVAVYSYDVADNTYVLDYGLSVELNGNDFGLRKNDTLELADNPNATTAKTTGIQDATSNYGAFTWDDPSLKYTPNKIINNTDSVRANVQVLEDGATELTKFTGVAMYETITTAPASVVYYEENFPGITYVTSDENEWVHYETTDDEGNSVAGNEQSADQDSNYGSDPNYEEDVIYDTDDAVKTVSFKLDTSSLDALQESGINALNAYLGLDAAADSNGTVNELVVKETAEVMYFDFVGTGFEIISRTTAEQYAVINVQVLKDTDGDGKFETLVTQKPVITESKGGTLYQVPIISITGLTRGEYRVAIKAAGSTDTTTRVLYIDGIRIYGPLSNEEALEYYNPEEYYASFDEVKALIKAGRIIYTDISVTDGDLLLVTGATLIEDVRGDTVLTSNEVTVEDYMYFGPNNELYLDGNSATGVIAFFLTPIDEDENGNPITDADRTVQVGAHRKADSMFDYYGYVTLVYGDTADEIIEGTNYYNIASGTEMYYTIDVSKLTLDENGKYLVMIGTNGSEESDTQLALTNLKVSGYTISFAESTLVKAYNASELMSISAVREAAAIFAARKPAEEDVEIIETEPAETEPEEDEYEETEPESTVDIISASLKADKVVSGKVATLNVQATAGAQTIVVTDADGNEVEAVKCVRKEDGDIVRFNFIWTVTGSRGDVLDFTVCVYDADGLPGANEATVSVTIK